MNSLYKGAGLLVVDVKIISANLRLKTKQKAPTTSSHRSNGAIKDP